MKMEFNRHGDEYRENGLEFNVKNAPYNVVLHPDTLDAEAHTGAFTFDYATKLFIKLKKKYAWLEDWAFVGRSSGWFVLLTWKEESEISPRSIGIIEAEVEKAYRNYYKKMKKFYAEFA